MPHKDPVARREWVKKWRKANPEKRLEQQRRHERRNPEQKRAVKRAYQQRNKEKWRGYELKCTYGITLDDVAAMRAAQNDMCAGCGVAFGVEFSNKPRVDHCHGTGKVRGLLCFACNVTLGHFDDDPAKLRALVEYLERTK
jgi:hypothetical protein